MYLFFEIRENLKIWHQWQVLSTFSFIFSSSHVILFCHTSPLHFYLFRYPKFRLFDRGIAHDKEYVQVQYQIIESAKVAGINVRSKDCK